MKMITVKGGCNIMNIQCVFTRSRLAIDVYAVVGEYDLSEDDTANPDRSVHRVSDVIMHPNFTSNTLLNDICLLK